MRHINLPEIEGKNIAVEEALVSIGEKGRDTYVLYSSEDFFKETYDQSMSDIITEEKYNSMLEKSNHLINIMCLKVLESIDS